MKGSGLEEALTTCYESITVEHMIKGKAVPRALRPLLTSSSLQIKLLTPFFPITHDCVDNAEVADVDLDLEEEQFEDEKEGEDVEVDEHNTGR